MYFECILSAQLTIILISKIEFQLATYLGKVSNARVFSRTLHTGKMNIMCILLQVPVVVSPL